MAVAYQYALITNNENCSTGDIFQNKHNDIVGTAEKW